MPFYTWQRLKAEDLRMHSGKWLANATQTIANNTNTKLAFATVDYNYGTLFTMSGDNKTVTVGADGLYGFGGQIQSQGIAGGGASYFWVGNGAATATADRWAITNKLNLAGAVPLHNVSNRKWLTNGQTVSAYYWHNHGSNRDTTVTGDSLPGMWIEYLGNG